VIKYTDAHALPYQKQVFVFAIIHMASSQTGRGRGRGARASASSTNPPPPSITPSTDISISTSPATEDNPPLTSTPIVHDPVSSTPSTDDTSAHDTGFSSSSTGTQPSSTSVPPAPKGKGRGRTKQNVVPEDPHWTVTNLTEAQFHSTSRPKKPDELGTLGEQIQVIANYFPILQFPHRGLVYKYQIQMRNKKNLEIHRDRRR
jgi:hypothetical protein